MQRLLEAREWKNLTTIRKRNGERGSGFTFRVVQVGADEGWISSSWLPFSCGVFLVCVRQRWVQCHRMFYWDDSKLQRLGKCWRTAGMDCKTSWSRFVRRGSLSSERVSFSESDHHYPGFLALSMHLVSPIIKFQTMCMMKTSLSPRVELGITLSLSSLLSKHRLDWSTTCWLL